MAEKIGSYTTKKGTELPLLNLKGKPYLQVAHRLVWFREECPNGILKTSLVSSGGEGRDAYAVFRAEVYMTTEQGSFLVASAHKKETQGGFADYIEKAETGAIGRALALAGYGTQFCSDEMEEGDRLADAPIDVAKKAKASESSEVTKTGTSARRPSFRKNMSVTDKVEVASGDDI